MRTVVAIFALLLVMRYDCKAGTPESPIEVRLNSLGGIFRRFDAAKPKSEVVVGRLIKRGTAYSLSWIQGDEVTRITGEQMLPNEVVDIAIATLKDKLPEGLRPEKANLLSLGRYQIGLDATIEWIWVAEFRVLDESPVGGIGFMPTLFVPLSMNGTVLLNVKRVEN